MKVLIVDDSEVLVERLTTRLMEVAGIEAVSHASNIADGALEIRRAQPDVVILDIHMPGGSGIDLLEMLKKDPIKPVVIMLSNYSGRQYRRKCFQSGARYFFDKSEEFHKVADVVRSLMDEASFGAGGNPQRTVSESF